MPEIAFLMGKSSSGKDNIFKALVGDKELNLKTVIMYTTRPMRAGEKEGVEYYYVDNEKALELEAASNSALTHLTIIKSFITCYNKSKMCHSFNNMSHFFNINICYVLTFAYFASCRYHSNKLFINKPFKELF